MNWNKIKLKPVLIQRGYFKGKQKSEIVYGSPPEEFSDIIIPVILDYHKVVESYYFRDSFGHWFSSVNNPWGTEYTYRVTHWADPISMDNN